MVEVAAVESGGEVLAPVGCQQLLAPKQVSAKWAAIPRSVVLGMTLRYSEKLSIVTDVE